MGRLFSLSGRTSLSLSSSNFQIISRIWSFLLWINPPLTHCVSDEARFSWILSLMEKIFWAENPRKCCFFFSHCEWYVSLQKLCLRLSNLSWGPPLPPIGLRDAWLSFFSCVNAWKRKKICMNAWNGFHVWCVKSITFLWLMQYLDLRVHLNVFFCKGGCLK